ncbi:MAG: class I SAM-dependent methyltransferase [Pseudomonadota bacterium]|nr:class I SAM-dependent methyltransferase [Pseudomonadota bacterium]
MTEGAIIQLPQWLKSPAGQYLLAWEQRHLDHAVADLFGFHALQLGLPQLDALRANRMPHRWLAVESTHDNNAASANSAPATSAPDAGATVDRRSEVDAARVLVVPAPSLRCHFDALPFDAASLDLVILPHALELARDPHLALREVERVLVPEGRVIIVGFNPASLWGTRQRLGRLRRRFSRTPGELFLPHAGEFVGYRRLRDWLRLLSFEVEAGRFGCYIPPLTSARWLARFEWMERAGEHWWPVFGALYYIVAVKRVRGMRLVGLIRKDARVKAVTAPAPVAVTPHARHANADSEEATVIRR